MDHRIQEPLESCGVLRQGGHPRHGVPQLQLSLREEVRVLPTVRHPPQRISQPVLQLPPLPGGEVRVCCNNPLTQCSGTIRHRHQGHQLHQGPVIHQRERQNKRQSQASDQLRSGLPPVPGQCEVRLREDRHLYC